MIGVGLSLGEVACRQASGPVLLATLNPASLYSESAELQGEGTISSTPTTAAGLHDGQSATASTCVATGTEDDGRALVAWKELWQVGTLASSGRISFLLYRFTCRKDAGVSVGGDHPFHAYATPLWENTATLSGSGSGPTWFDIDSAGVLALRGYCDIPTFHSIHDPAEQSWTEALVNSCRHGWVFDFAGATATSPGTVWVEEFCVEVWGIP